ncbi:integrase [Pseudomonas aeruginosa]
MQLPPKLAFLATYFVEPSEAYRSAIWLLNNFDEDIWKYNLGYKQPKQLDWNVTLHDGTLLTAPKNKNLLNGFKYYLTTSTRDITGHSETNQLNGSQRQRFSKACHIIDYLLINGDRYKLGSYGLEGLTGGNLIEILDNLASNSLIAETVYNWKSKLREFCLALLSKTNESAIQEIILNTPQLSIITQEQIDNDSLGIPHDLIPKTRAALYLSGLYHKQADGNQPNTILLSKLIYPETLIGKNKNKPVYQILGYNDDCSLFDREYPAAPVTSGVREQLTESTYRDYRQAIYNLGVLHEIHLPAPTIDALKQAGLFSPNLSRLGRYRTLPSEIVFKALRQSIEFHLDYGQKLTKAFCRVALECKKRNISPSSLTDEEIKLLVPTELIDLGVTTLCLAMRSPAALDKHRNIKGQRTDYYSKLRKNNGLYELLAVYIGAIQLAIGIFMARRASELYGLYADSCLDDTEQWLLFMNAKTTRHLFGMRRRAARPIEPIAVDMIKTLIRMQKILVRIGYIPKLQTLFALPNFRGNQSLTDSSVYLYNRNLDFFCDYFESQVNTEGQRYYFRQHQMRRFFAMLFFYCGSFAKLDTLQWMMGHADPSHIYRYITESTDGAVLAGAKAHFAAERLRDGDMENFEELRQLLKERYGSDDFTIIDAHDLEDQIQELIQEGWIEIEPEFFTDHQEKKFKIVARLKRCPEVV